jgi:hypothetical protein
MNCGSRTAVGEGPGSALGAVDFGRGGVAARVISFFHNETVPLFALTMYGKNEQDDLSQADRNAFRQLTKVLVDNWSNRG